MQVHVEEISPAQKKLTIELPVELVDAEIEKYYAGVQKNAKMVGFRPGKVPMHVIKQNCAESMPHVVRPRLYNLTLGKALQAHNIEPVDSPVIEAETLQQGAPFKFSALVQVVPGGNAKANTGLDAEKESESGYVFGWKDCLKRTKKIMP